MKTPFFDLHTHPAIKAAWFGKDLTKKHVLRPQPGVLNMDPLGFNPFVVRASFPKLKRDTNNRSSFLLSAIYALEHRALYEDLRLKTPLFSFPLITLLKIARVCPSFNRVFRDFVKPDYFTITINTIEAIEKEALKDSSVCFARSVEDLETEKGTEPKKTGKTVFIHALEGAQSLEGRHTLEIQLATNSRDGNPKQLRRRTREEEKIIENELLTNLEVLFDRSVAVMGLSHFYPNEITKSCFSFPERTLGMVPHQSWRNIVNGQKKGLTDGGRRIVERMLDMGMIIDVSHVSPKGRMDIYKLVDDRWKSGEKQGQTREGCVIASHTGAQELHHHPYNLADWEIKWIADHGGVTGIIFSTYWLSGHGEAKLGLGYIEKTIDHITNVGGEHVVAFGSDFDGFSDPPDDLADFSEWHHLTDYLELMHLRTGDGEPLNERFIRGFVDYTSSSKGSSVPDNADNNDSIPNSIRKKYNPSQIEGFMWRNAFETIQRGWGKRS